MRARFALKSQTHIGQVKVRMLDPKLKICFILLGVLLSKVKLLAFEILTHE